MKLLFVILASIVISCNGMVYAGDEGESIFSTYTAIAVDKFRDIMREGNASLGVPVLDPFQLDQYPFNLTEKGLIDVKGLITDMKVDGLSYFKVIKADFSIIGVKISLHLFWDSIKLFTDYSVRGTLANVMSIYGLGDVDANVQGLDVDVNFSLSVRDEKPYVRSFESAIKLKELDVKITGLFYDEEISKLLSTMISDMVPQLIEDYQVELTTKLNVFVTNFINDFVKDKSIMDLIGLLS